MIRNSPLIFTALVNVAVNASGNNYTPGDKVNIAGGLGGVAVVTSISGGGPQGPVSGLFLTQGGQGFTTAQTGVSTTGGTGSGLTVDTFVSNNDPAFSNADWVMQTILAPPFAWRWNRVQDSPTVPTFKTTPGITDYSVNIPNFGWLEKGVAYDPSDAYASYELQVGLNAPQETLSNQPCRVSAQADDDAGNVTFRIFPAPDIPYNVALIYQKAAPQFTSLTQTWSPIPDYLSYIFNQGFDAKSYEYFSDPRFSSSMQLFYTQLASVMEGLDSSQKNLWLHDRLASLRQSNMVAQGKA